MDVGLACFLALISGIMLFLMFIESISERSEGLFIPVVGLIALWWVWTGGIIYSFHIDRPFYIVAEYEIKEINNIDVIVDNTQIKNMNQEFNRDLEEGEKVYKLGERWKLPFYYGSTWLVDENGLKNYIKESDE